jgi:hypothetical protein
MEPKRLGLLGQRGSRRGGKANIFPSNTEASCRRVVVLAPSSGGQTALWALWDTGRRRAVLA